MLQQHHKRSRRRFVRSLSSLTAEIRAAKIFRNPDVSRSPAQIHRRPLTFVALQSTMGKTTTGLMLLVEDYH